MMTNDIRDIIRKKKSDQPKVEPCRYYINELSEVSTEEANKYIAEKYKTISRLKKKVNAFVEVYLDFINKGANNFLNESKCKDYDLSVESVYSGMAGIALLFNFYASKRKNKHKREKAKNIIEKCMSILNHEFDNCTYLTGISGIYVTAAEIYNDMGDLDNVKKMIEKVVDLLPRALNEKNPDVLLYGRAGYLYSLLVLKSIGWDDPERDELIRKVVISILLGGINTCANDMQRTSLIYECHRKKYLGAAQGLCGVLFCLLLAINYITIKERDNFIKPALDYILTLRYESGNLPSSLCDEPDLLVQWCHGASGASHTFALAYKVLRDKKYLEAAEEFADVVWKRGLLTKGYGLCHGVSGNAYSFIVLFRITGSVKYLFRAAKFVDWCISVDHKDALSKYPNSLFEGIPGVIYAMLDIQEPHKAKFPGFHDLLLKF